MNLGTTAKHAAMVWACVEKEDTDLVKKNVQSMRWRATDEEADQRGPGERLRKKNCKARTLNMEDAIDR